MIIVDGKEIRPKDLKSFCSEICDSPDSYYKILITPENRSFYPNLEYKDLVALINDHDEDTQALALKALLVFYPSTRKFSYFNYFGDNVSLINNRYEFAIETDLIQHLLKMLKNEYDKFGERWDDLLSWSYWSIIRALAILKNMLNNSINDDYSMKYFMAICESGGAQGLKMLEEAFPLLVESTIQAFTPDALASNFHTKIQNEIQKENPENNSKLKNLISSFTTLVSDTENFKPKNLPIFFETLDKLKKDITKQKTENDSKDSLTVIVDNCLKILKRFSIEKQTSLSDNNSSMFSETQKNNGSKKTPLNKDEDHPLSIK